MCNQQDDEPQKPNIFSCGTTELTQDAILAYIFSWADKEHSKYPEHKAAQKFIKKLLSKAGSKYSNPIKTVEVRTQWQKIDVVTLINEDLVIVIENKKGTGQHDDQLKRYKKLIKKEFGNRKLQFMYIQSVVECRGHSGIVKYHDYSYISFYELLEMVTDSVKDPQCKNQIFGEYKDFLTEHKELHDQWQKESVTKFGWHDIYGLYDKLEQEKVLSDSWWGYANTVGGGVQWFYIPSHSNEYNLQLEKASNNELRLLVKTTRFDYEKRWALLGTLQERASKFGFSKIDKAGRFRKGHSTSTAWIFLGGENSMPLNKNGTLNYKKLVEGIVNAKKLLTSLASLKQFK